MNEITKETIEEVMEIYRGHKDMTMSEAIEIYKAVQLRKILDTLDDIEVDLGSITDENGIQYVKGEIAPCAY